MFFQVILQEQGGNTKNVTKIARDEQPGINFGLLESVAQISQILSLESIQLYSSSSQRMHSIFVTYGKIGHQSLYNSRYYIEIEILQNLKHLVE